MHIFIIYTIQTEIYLQSETTVRRVCKVSYYYNGKKRQVKFTRY